MVNEENVKHYLTEWLRVFNIDVYWEKKNKWNYPIFKSDNISKPDLLIKKKYGWDVYAIEVKDSNGGDMNILNSFVQISKYAKESTDFFINDNKANICGFLVATQKSINGHLFEYETIKDVGKGRLFAINRKQVPINEYDKTLNFIRLLWRNAKENEINIPIGALLSNILNNTNSIAPMLFMKTQKWSTYIVWDKI